MNVNILATEYAKAIVDISCEQKKQKEYYLQFRDFYHDLKNNNDFLKMFFSNMLTIQDKHQIITNIYGSSFDKYVLNFIKYIIDKNDCKYIMNILNNVLEGLVNELNYVILEISSPYKLDNYHIEQIEQEIKKKNPEIKEILTFQKIKPNLIAGIQIQYNNQKYDNSIKTKLDLIKSMNKGDK